MDNIATILRLTLLVPVLALLVGGSPAGATATQTLNSGWLLDVARNTILTSVPWSTAGVTVEIASVPADIQVYSDGRLDVRGILERTPLSIKDIAAVGVEVLVDGRLYMRFDPTPYLKATIQTFILTRDIERGEILAESDVVETGVDVTDLPTGQLPSSIDEITGFAAKIGLQTGRVVTLNMLELPIVVQRGRPVAVYIQIGDAAVVLNGIALDNGAVGDSIRVRNPDSQAIISASVTGPGKAEIRLAG
jgi:flagella basal body P-ring formation protein FlgA